MSEFHPSQNMPGCMMPDGGECCAGYSALHDEYFILKARIAELEAALREIIEEVGTSTRANKIASIALQAKGEI